MGKRNCYGRLAETRRKMDVEKQRPRWVTRRGAGKRETETENERWI